MESTSFLIESTQVLRESIHFYWSRLETLIGRLICRWVDLILQAMVYRFLFVTGEPTQSQSWADSLWPVDCWALYGTPKAMAKVQSLWGGHGVSRTSLGPRMKGCQPFNSWDLRVLGLEGLTYIWARIEFKIMRLGQVMGVHRLEWVQSYIELARGIFGLGHIDLVYKDTLYSDSMKQMNTKPFSF